MYAKKSLGQHFLKSEKALNSIVEAGQVKAEDTVLEIGPGTGALTEKLLAKSLKLIAVEKDEGLCELLKTKFKKEIYSGQFTLICDDILNFVPESYKLEALSYKLIANIPYNITGAILEKFLGSDCQPKTMVLLVQKEVAKRVVAQDEKESILSISVKAYGTPRYVETVKAGSFVPIPQVDSAIIAIESISKDLFKTFTEKEFFKILKAGFKSKRKKLSSNLSTIYPPDKVKAVFLKLGLDENLRAEDVKLPVWRELIKSIQY